MEKRRALLKKVVGVASVGAIGSALPNAWVKPVINSVILPAHAQTSIATFSLTVTSTNFATDQCGSGGETAQIDGTVLASDARDLSGVMLNIRYTDNPPDGDFTDIPVVVQAGNVFNFSGLVVPSVGMWNFFPYRIVATFTDQTTYGSASATAEGNCANNAPIIGASRQSYDS